LLFWEKFAIIIKYKSLNREGEDIK
jgi:hypothetical protein